MNLIKKMQFANNYMAINQHSWQKNLSFFKNGNFFTLSLACILSFLGITILTVQIKTKFECETINDGVQTLCLKFKISGSPPKKTHFATYFGACPSPPPLKKCP